MLPQVDKAGFEKAMEEARERSKAGGKKAAGTGLKFEAEATAWLSKSGVPLTVRAGPVTFDTRRSRAVPPQHVARTTVQAVHELHMRYP
jgi:hypothetical protein